MQVNLKSFVWQKELLDQIVMPYVDGGVYPSISVVKARRQVGKSVGCIELLLVTALKKKASVSAVVEPTWSQSQRMLKQCKKAWASLVLTSNSSDGTITLKNGSEVHFFSAGQGEGLRGPTVSGILVVDESAYISDEVYATILPWTDVHRAPVVLVSTPKFKTGFFYQEYMHAVSGDVGYQLFDWSSAKYNVCGGTTMVDLLPEDRLEQYRQRLPKIQFECDYLAQFVDAESVLFGEFKRSIIEAPTPSRDVYIGIDFGSGSGGDYTALVVVNQFGEVIIANHFNKAGSLAQVEWLAQQLESIVDKGYRIARCYCETNNTGSVQYPLLRQRVDGKSSIYNSLRPIEMSHELKLDVIGKLQIAFDSESIKLVRGLDDLYHELSTFESHLTPGGKLTYDATANSHDDLVISLSYAWKAYEEINRKNGQGRYTLM